MRVLLDACILYPTVLREILLGVAARGGFAPLYAPRILEEWARAAARAGPQVEQQARVEIALLRAQFPKGEVTPDLQIEQTLSLPDLDDIHVLAAAIKAEAEVLLTANLRDFPGRTLSRHGIRAQAPDALLLQLLEEGVPVADVVGEVQARTQHISGREQPLRPLLKRAGLPRLGKRLTATD